MLRLRLVALLLALLALLLTGPSTLAQGVTAEPELQRVARTVPFQAVATVNLNLRAGPSTATDKVGLLPEGSAIEVLEVRAGWFRIGSGDTIGWVSADFVRLPTGTAGQFPARAPQRTTPFEGLTTDNLNLRSRPSINAEKIGFLPPRRRVTVVEQQPDWYRIESEDLRGWVASLYVEAAPTVATNADLAPSPSERDTPPKVALEAEARVQINTENRQLRNENSRLAGDLAEAQIQARQSVVDHNTLVQELSASQTRMGEARSENQDLTQRLATLNGQAMAAEERVAELETELGTVRTNSKSRSEVRQLRSEEKRLRKENEALAKQTEQQQNQLVRVAEELKAAQADIEEANVALRSMLAENRQLGVALEAAQSASNQPAAPEAKDTIGDLTPLKPLVRPPVQETAVQDLTVEETAVEGTAVERALVAATPLPNPSVALGQPLEPADLEGTPVPEPPQADPLSLVAETIESWRAAWSSQDVGRYLAAYAPNFRPENLSLTAWQQSRRQRIAAPSFVEVTVGTPQVQQTAQGRVLVRFSQDYRSDTFSDRVFKTLTLELSPEGTWLILSEASSAIP